jgi:hypothetical protein
VTPRTDEDQIADALEAAGWELARMVRYFTGFRCRTRVEDDRLIGLDAAMEKVLEALPRVGRQPVTFDLLKELRERD